VSEVDPFVNAIRFLTRFPVPSTESLDDDWLARAAKYFPAVGLMVGALSALVFVIAARFWSGLIPAVLAVAASIWVTGAFHEDGLADTVDGFGGGSSVEARLAIMKNSRIGTYGTLALALATLLRIGALATLLPSVAAAALLASHACGRGAGVLVMNALPHAGDPSATKVMYSAGALSRREIVVALEFCLAGLLPVLLMRPSAVVVGLIIAGGLAAFVVAKARRLIGGSTGDVLGAVEQVVEIGFLLGIAAAA